MNTTTNETALQELHLVKRELEAIRAENEALKEWVTAIAESHQAMPEWIRQSAISLLAVNAGLVVSTKYEYGVEYEFTGIKPNLPHGTLLEITFHCGQKMRTKLGSTTFDFRPMYDPRPASFRLIDEDNG